MFNTATKTRSKILTAATLTMLAFTVVATSFSTDAYAGKRERWIAGGVAAGIIGTAIIANERRRSREHRRYRERRHYRTSSWDRHVARCYRAYRSYSERTDTFIGYDGRERRCRK